ncbi:MAG: DUF2207 domain-containing protein [Anaerolineae bacterium]|nr:DUF2207 domain-containing protein [Anaerolineae bacterium]
MRLRSRRPRMALSWIWVVLLALGLLLARGTLAASAQTGKSFHWNRYDYTVDILENGDMLFEVTMAFSFDSGSFSQGYFSFDMDRLEDVRDVSVFEGERAYTPVSSEREHGYLATVDDQFEVLWWFPPTANAERTFTLRYRVIGGLRIYEEGDQFWWFFYAGDRPGRIDQGTITVRLPGSVAPEELRLASNPATVPIEQVDSRTVQARVQGLPANQSVELRVQFPHGLVQARPPSWQAAADRLVDYNERWRPVVELGLLALSILTLVGGIGGVVALWYSRGRDKPVGVVAEYLSEPPSDLRPGLAGALVDEKVDIQDILATIVDLGRRGVLEIEETQQPGFLGIGERRDFVYRRLGGGADLSQYESTLVSQLFGQKTEVRLSELKNRFYQAIPRIARDMYEELTQQGFFHGNPEKVRARWQGFGIAGIVLSFVAFLCLSVFISQYAGTFFCLPLASGIGFLLLTIVGSAMPRKSEAGAEEAARWQAFKRYLEDIERYDDLGEKKSIFERFLPYAIAFGMEKEYIRKFSRVEAPAPTWYHPYPPVIYGGGRPYPRETAAGPTPVSQTGGAMPSLQGMSNSMSASLQSMSDGLQSMLNSASSTLTSQPRSSGSGGGGWSGGGGGFGGGGGGGGGSGAR